MSKDVVKTDHDHAADASPAPGDAEDLERALRQAIPRDQLHLVFQPQVSVASGEIVGVEALLRWEHPVLGAVPPERFIPVAERSGQIVAIGDWVLRRACVLARKWQREGLPAVRMMVNVSARQLGGPLAARVEYLLAETGLEPRRLGLELTETALMQDIDAAVAQLRRLRGLGIEIALDDFGTGYSSLSHLRRLPLDVVKIDRSLIPGVTGCSDALPIVRAIIAMTHSLGLKVLAEGVANEAQLEMLAASHCDQLQGFHFSAPVSARDAEAMLRAGRRWPVLERRRVSRARRILLVDDEAPVLGRIAQRLDAHFGGAVQLTACDDPHAAMRQLRETRFDIVACDLRMPGVDGITLLNRARLLQPDAVRMMLLGAADLAVVLDDPRQVDVFRYLAKPGLPEQVLAHFQAALAQVECLQALNLLSDDPAVFQAGPGTAVLELMDLEQSEPGITSVARGPLDEIVLPSQLMTLPGDLWVPSARAARAP